MNCRRRDFYALLFIVLVRCVFAASAAHRTLEARDVGVTQPHPHRVVVACKSTQRMYVLLLMLLNVYKPEAYASRRETFIVAYRMLTYLVPAKAWGMGDTICAEVQLVVMYALRDFFTGAFLPLRTERHVLCQVAVSERAFFVFFVFLRLV